MLAEKAAAEKKAKQKRTRIIVGVIAALAIAATVVVTKVIIPENQYKAAETLFEAGQYEEAITAFEALGSYKDSEDRARQITSKIYENNALKEAAQLEEKAAADYAEAVVLMENKEYYNAMAAFSALRDYKDSKELAIESKYLYACELVKNGSYGKAIPYFEELGDYKDSSEQIEKYYIGIYGAEIYQHFKSVKIGDTFLFGKYEQDNNTANGAEKIEWIVLEKKSSSKLLLLLVSKYALDCQPYNTTRTSVTWKTCSLRKWLNGTFLSTAFRTEEQSMIQTSTSPMTDQIFLLSFDEADKYFSSDIERKCELTVYAMEQGALAFNSDRTAGRETCWWWLLSDNEADYTAAVNGDGITYWRALYVDNGRIAVRPAMWVEIG